MSNIRADVNFRMQQLAAKKLADKYIGRCGEPPSLLSRRAASKLQDLNDDDRKHLRFCLDLVRAAIGRRNEDASAALDFIVAVLDRDYALYRSEKLK